MILLAGVRSEEPLRLVAEALDEEGTPYRMFHQRDFDHLSLHVRVERGHVRGALEMPDGVLPLEEVHGVYLRLMDDRVLPELETEPEASQRRHHCRALHEALLRWSEITPARVVNRLAAMGSNFSKPYQAQAILAAGFRTPPTLISNDPDRVLAFQREHRRIIYKSISGVRSIVRELGEAERARLDRIRWCPTQFQAYVEGQDVRVHTIGDAVFATAITTTGTDYRYACREEGGSTELEAVSLGADLEARCVGLARRLGLDFAGIDLKLSPGGAVYCFEVNPCPAYSYYEGHTGQPIARTLARYLAA
ncbi:MAG: glutathione synthase [Gemmatimonadota bacterium]